MDDDLRQNVSPSSSIAISSRTVTRLWVGGSSGLAQTYFNNVKSFTKTSSSTSSIRWILVGQEASAPDWMASSTSSNCFPEVATVTSSIEYRCCDLTDSSSIMKLVEELEKIPVDQVLLSVRPPLVTPRTNAQAFRYAEVLVQGFSELLMQMIDRQKNPPSVVIHVSSIAAIDHLNRHHRRSETSQPDPPSETLRYPYDWFKRRCEEVVARICSNENDHSKAIPFTNLRFGAIFSDSDACIQCNALALQALAGPYLDVPIDCNSSRNAASLIHQILIIQPDEKKEKLRPVYYYTRPLLLPEPVPYGEFLVAYRKAYNFYNKWYVIWLPTTFVNGLVAAFHCLTLWLGSFVPYLESIDYLLQVTCQEHSFDCSAVAQDFPHLLADEESMNACFQRRRRQEREQQQQQVKTSHRLRDKKTN